MKWKCLHCFEWSETVPCEYCGAPKPDEARKTEIEIRDDVLDRLRGGPKTRMRELAAYCEMEYDDFMEALHAYVNSDSDYDFIHLNIDTPYDQVSQMWDDFELIVGEVVPANKRDNPFSCSC